MMRLQNLSPLFAISVLGICDCERSYGQSSPPGAAQMVVDHSTGQEDAVVTARPGVLLTENLLVFPRSSAPDAPAQLWRTDGTAAGTVPVLKYGLANGAGVNGRLVQFGTRALFVTADADGASSLWITDGSGGGTTRLRTFRGATDGVPSNFVVAQSVVFFSAQLGSDANDPGKELWVTDGTADGTRMVADVASGPVSSSPLGIATFGNGLVFEYTLASGQRGVALTNATNTGAVVVNVAPYNARTTPTPAAGPIGTDIMLAVSGTYTRVDVNTGDVGPTIMNDFSGAPFVESFGNLCLISNSTSFQGIAARTDGTSIGTVRIGLSGGIGRVTTPIFRTPTSVVLPVHAINGLELWRSDLTDVGTSRLVSLSQGVATNLVRGVVAGGKFWILASSLTSSGWWSSDGTADGTKSVLSGSRFEFSRVSRMYDGGTFACFWQTDRNSEGRVRQVLSSSDGTADGTHVIGEFVSTRPSLGPVIGRVGAKLVFNVQSHETGNALWVTDGTAAGTRPLAESKGYTDSTSCLGSAAIDGAVISLVQRPGEAMELWRARGTRWDLLHTFAADERLYRPYLPLSIGRRAVFVIARGNVRELWSTDGTENGTVRVADVLSVSSGAASMFVRVGERVCFLSRNGPTLYLKATDGTSEGTVDLLTLSSNPFANAMYFGAGNGHLYYSSSPNLWITDGTAAGTRLVSGTFSTLGSGESISVFDRYAVLIRAGTSSGLWRLDSATDELRLIGPVTTRPFAWAGGLLVLRPAGSSWSLSSMNIAGYETLLHTESISAGVSHAGNLIAVGRRVFFTASDELWVTDGTPCGTVRVGTESERPAIANPLELTACGDTLFFSAFDPAQGREPWYVLPGSRVARRVGDLTPGPGSSMAQGFVREGTFVHFFARDSVRGAEPWVLNLCGADFDNSGGVTVSDVHAFLEAWFGGCVDAQASGCAAGSGDFDRDGVLSVQDVLAFLAAWFGGC